MTNIDITFGRAFRVWWSYVWRTLVLSLIVIIPMQVFSFVWFVPHVRAAVAGHGHGLGVRAAFELFGVLWPIAIICIIILQTTAMRWMLRRARWADFKLIASPLEAPSDR